MKTNKKVISIVLSILCFVFLAGCGQGGADKMIEIPVKTYFDQQKIVVKIPKKAMMFGNTLSEGGFLSQEAFSTVKNDFIKDNPNFKFKEYSDHCLLLTTGESGAMRHYLLTLYTDVNYGVFAPSIYTGYIDENGTTSDTSGEQLYYPLHLLQHKDISERSNFLAAGGNRVIPNLFYPFNSTKEEFKQFYADTGYFTIEDTEDGFIINIPEGNPDEERIFKEKYRFQFQENNGVPQVMYSKVA